MQNNKNDNPPPITPSKKKKTGSIFLSGLFGLLIVFIITIIIMYPDYVKSYIQKGKKTVAPAYVTNTLAESNDSQQSPQDTAPETDNSISNNININDTTGNDSYKKLQQSLEEISTKLSQSNYNQLITQQQLKDLKTSIDEMQSSNYLELVMVITHLIDSLNYSAPFDNVLIRFTYINQNNSLNTPLLKLMPIAQDGIPTKNLIIQQYDDLFKEMTLDRFQNSTNLRNMLKYYFYSLVFIKTTERKSKSSALSGLYLDILDGNYTAALKKLDYIPDFTEKDTLKKSIEYKILAIESIEKLSDELSKITKRRLINNVQ